MIASPAQLARFKRDLERIAQEPVAVEQIFSTIYGMTSEIGALRIYRKYRGKIRAEYSRPRDSWFVSLDLPA